MVHASDPGIFKKQSDPNRNARIRMSGIAGLVACTSSKLNASNGGEDDDEWGPLESMQPVGSMQGDEIQCHAGLRVLIERWRRITELQCTRDVDHILSQCGRYDYKNMRQVLSLIELSLGARSRESVFENARFMNARIILSEGISTSSFVGVGMKDHFGYY